MGSVYDAKAKAKANFFLLKEIKKETSTNKQKHQLSGLDSKLLPLTRQNAGLYDFFWTELLWAFIGDVKDLFSVRKMMKSTRYAKGNFGLQFPIGPYSYDQFLSFNKMPNPEATVFVDTTSCKQQSVSQIQRRENIRRFYLKSQSIPTIVEKNNIGRGVQLRFVTAWTSKVVLEDSEDPDNGMLETTTSHPIPSKILHISVTCESTDADARTIGFEVSHSTVFLDIEPAIHNDGYDMVHMGVFTDAAHAQTFSLTVSNGQDFQLKTNAVSLTVTQFDDSCLFHSCASVQNLHLQRSCRWCKNDCDWKREPVRDWDAMLQCFSHDIANFPNLVELCLSQCALHEHWNVAKLVEEFPSIQISCVQFSSKFNALNNFLPSAIANLIMSWVMEINK